MYIDGRNLRTTARLNPLGIGPSSFTENVSAAFAATRAINLQISQSLNLTEAYDDYIDHIFATTGKRLRNPAHIWQGESPKTSPNAPGRVALHADEFHAEANALAEETGRFAPLSFDDIGLSVQAKVAELDLIRSSAEARYGDGGMNLGGFFGDMGAFFTDPIIAVSSLYAPARAASVLRTGIEMALVTGGAELLIQPEIQKYRAVLGLPSGVGLGAMNVAFAAGAGGVFGIGVKLAGLGLRNLLGIHAAVVTTPDRNQVLARNTAEAVVGAEDSFGRGGGVTAFAEEAAEAAEEGVALTSFSSYRPNVAWRLERGDYGPGTRQRADAQAAIDELDPGATGETFGVSGGFDTPTPRQRAFAESGGFDEVLDRPKLPSELAGAKPRYQQSELVFASDIDRALFIISQKTLSRRDADYRAWLRETLGATDADIDELAQQTRAAVGDAAKNRGADGDPINVGDADFQVKGQELPADPRPAPTVEPRPQVRSRTPDEEAARTEAHEVVQEVIAENGTEVPAGMAEALAIMRGEAEMPDPGQSLIQWLIANGGVRDESGWLAGVLRMERGGSAMPRLLNNQGIEVTERLTKKGDVRRAPMNIEDEAGARAAEAGFFPRLLAEINSDGPAPNTRDVLEEAIVDELAGNKLYIVDEVTEAAQDMDLTVRRLEEDMWRAGLDVDELSDVEIAATLKRLEEGMEEDFRVLVDTEPDTAIPIDTVLDPTTGKPKSVTVTVRQIQDEIDADQRLVDELNNCFIPGFSI